MRSKIFCWSVQPVLAGAVVFFVAASAFAADPIPRPPIPPGAIQPIEEALPPQPEESPAVPEPADIDTLAPVVLNRIGLPVPRGNHYDCYAATKLGPHQPRRVGLSDQFGRRWVSVLRVTRICVPANKFHNGRITPAPDPRLHLVCYEVITPVPQPPIPVVLIRNQFGYAKLRVERKIRELCLPSSKIKLR